MHWLNTRLEVPHRLRAIVRARESSVIVLALIVGAIAGLAVSAMGQLVGLMHVMFFGLDPGERLSAQVSLNPLYAFLTPCLGGLLFGLVTAYIARRRGTEVDPLEANALHGGRMSLRGSLIVAAQTVWSSGVGASVGLEAGYTQLASGIASMIGQAFRLRRSDMRILVGCGAAGAIAGAFGAPLGGAFYGFELIIGSYSAASLAPVGMAALLGYLTAQIFTPDRLGIEAGATTQDALSRRLFVDRSRRSDEGRSRATTDVEHRAAERLPGHRDDSTPEEAEEVRPDAPVRVGGSTEDFGDAPPPLCH